MQLFGKVKVLLLMVYVIGLTSSTKELDRLKSIVKHLETRLNFEFTLRDEDIDEITVRLNGIDKVLNATIGKEHSIPEAATKASKIDFETVDTLKEDFTRLRTAFIEEKSESNITRLRAEFIGEKSEAKRFRREIPKIQSNLVSLSKDVNSYCKATVNNTEQLLTNFVTAKNMSDDVIFMSENERKLLKSISEQVQLNTVNDKEMAKQIENIKILVTNLFSHINSLHFGNSCRKPWVHHMSNIENVIYKLVQGFKVYCDQSTDGGGWIVFQRRLNGETDFYRNWTEFRKGKSQTFRNKTNSESKFRDEDFAEITERLDDIDKVLNATIGKEPLNPSVVTKASKIDFETVDTLEEDFTRLRTAFTAEKSEAASEYLSVLTSNGVYELRIEIEDFEGNSAYAKYSKFKIYPEEDNYKLEVSGYSGTAGNSLAWHNGMMFTTFDRDHDKSSSNCAKDWHGAWWYDNCHYSNLNGQYYNQPGKIDSTGITWYDWKNDYICLKKVEMKFR
ncbi:fibrinogen beta chain-like [Ruditapes philippinarum]|uniref:fibrinogen beta chain-like n=1 Tax=Ruditapes philippinarum TaxID=129788 RepID=UPI00295B51ED|nr:fibrinogen beta chain-like [Ruditapes philippinarum]